MCHDMLWSDHDVVACLDDFVCWESDCIFLDDLFNDCLGNARGVCGCCKGTAVAGNSPPPW